MRMDKLAYLVAAMATMGYGSQVLAGANDWWRNTTDPLGPHHPFERSTAKSKIDKPLLRKSIARHHQ
jgi:hypothetical protein